MGVKLALLIGNSQYTDSYLTQLVTPDTDVRALANVLSEESIGAFDRVDILLNKSEQEITRAIEKFFYKRSRQDLLLLYFSGHGILNEVGQLFLAVKDTKREMLRSTAVSSGFITDIMDACRSRRQVLILDCCHSGAFARGKKGAGQKLGTSVHTGQAFEGKGYGRIVLTASDATQYAWEQGELIGDSQNSLFTHYLIQGLQTGAADLGRDGQVTIDELFDYVSKRVTENTTFQTPHIWSYGQGGDIVIANNHHAGLGGQEVDGRIIEHLQDPDARVRMVAVEQLMELARGEDTELVQLVCRELEVLAQNDDDRLIRRTVQHFLREQATAFIGAMIEEIAFSIFKGHWEQATAVLQQLENISPQNRQIAYWRKRLKESQQGGGYGEKYRVALENVDELTAIVSDIATLIGAKSNDLVKLRIDGEVKPGLDLITEAQELNEHIQMLRGQFFSVIVIGSASSGKSTLVEALLSAQYMLGLRRAWSVIDTPGLFNDSNQDEAIAYQIQAYQVPLFILNGLQALTQKEKQYIETELLKRFPFDKLLFVVNTFGVVEPDGQKEIDEWLREYLLPFYYEMNISRQEAEALYERRVFFCHVRQAMAAATQEPVAVRDRVKSGILTLEWELESFLTSRDYFSARTESIRHILKQVVLKAHKAIQAEQVTLDETIKRLEQLEVGPMHEVRASVEVEKQRLSMVAEKITTLQSLAVDLSEEGHLYNETA